MIVRHFGASPLALSGRLSIALVLAGLPRLTWGAVDAGVVASTGFGSLLQGLLGLALVLGLLYGFLILLRRFGPAASHGQGIVKVVGGVMLSPRERLVMVEVNDTWLVLGVASGQVSLLHSLPKPDDADQLTEPPIAPFASRLAAMLRQSGKS